MACAEIQEAFITQLREEELRARRALRVLRHQEGQIRRLERLHHDSQTGICPPKQIVQQERMTECKRDLETVELTDRKRTAEVQQIQREMEHTKQVLLRSKGKIENLERLVEDMESVEMSSQVNLLTAEMSGWRMAIDDALKGIEKSTRMNNNNGGSPADGNERLWKTALRYFTPQQTAFLLSLTQKNAKINHKNITIPRP